MTPQTEKDLLAAIGRRQAIATAAGKWDIAMLLEGDSWARKPGGDLGDSLEKRVRRVWNNATPGHTAAGIAWGDSDQYDEMVRAFQKLTDEKDPPSCVIVSGGGNDAQHAFSNILNHARDLAAPDRLEPDIVEGNFDRWERALIYICQLYDHLADHYLGHRIPVYVHGYDLIRLLGVPFKVGPISLAGPWIDPVLRELGYGELPIEARRALINGLLLRWNDERLPQLEQRVDSLRYVRLVGTLTTDELWHDEMHPTGTGFDLIAEKFEARAREEIGA